MAKSNGELMAKLEAKKEAAPKERTVADQIADYLQKPDVQQQIQAYGLKLLTPERLGRLLLTLLRTKPELSECTFLSLMACLMLAAQYELEIGTPQCYVIKRKRNTAKRGEPDKWIAEAEFQIGYQGFIELIHRAHPGCRVAAHPLYSLDKFIHRYGYESETLVHEPAFPNRGELIGFYAYFVRGEHRACEVMTLPEVEEIKERTTSRDWKTKEIVGPWITDPIEMGRKTPLRKLWKWIPKTPQLNEAVQHLGLDIEGIEKRPQGTMSLNLEPIGTAAAPIAVLEQSPFLALPDAENYTEEEIAALTAEAGAVQTGA